MEITVIYNGPLCFENYCTMHWSYKKERGKAGSAQGRDVKLKKVWKKFPNFVVISWKNNLGLDVPFSNSLISLSCFSKGIWSLVLL